MSGTVRAGLLFGLGAVVAFFAALFLPIPCVNFILALISVIALGWGAGYTAAKSTGATSDQRLGRGLTAGAIGGTVVLLGSTVALLLLSGVILNLPGVREQFAAALAENPDTSNLNPDDFGAALGVGLGALGFCLGLFNFLLMLLGGLFGGLMWRGAPTTADYVPAGGSYGPPASGSYIPSQSSTPGYTPPANTEGGARIYDPNDPNRPQ